MADRRQSPHHTQSRQSTDRQPENVEQEVEVNVVGDKEDDAVAKQTITLTTNVSFVYNSSTKTSHKFEFCSNV